jgi:D-alanyl-D-alanine carboxypeptidase
MGEATRPSAPTARAVVFLAFLLAVAGLGWSSSQPVRAGGLDPAVAQALKAELKELRLGLGEPGLSLAIRLPNGTIWTAVSGYASEEKNHKRKLTSRTAFSAGSITKTFIGALVMQEVQKGVIHLDDPISRWLPGYPNARHLLISELLQHTSGLYDYFDNPKYEHLVFGRPHHVWTLSQILSLVLAPWFAPGRGWAYSNTNFILLGAILQKVTGLSVGKLIRQRLLGPQRLRLTQFQDRPPTLADEANGYLSFGYGWVPWTDGTTYRPNTSAATVAWSVGAILASPSDLVRWAHALYAEDAVVSAASVAKMTDFNKHDYGLATERFTTSNNPVKHLNLWGHAGSLRGFEAQMWYVPKKDVTISLMGNRGRVSLRPAIRKLLRTYFRAVKG